MRSFVRDPAKCERERAPTARLPTRPPFELREKLRAFAQKRSMGHNSDRLPGRGGVASCSLS